jgi:hypothetical protein
MVLSIAKALKGKKAHESVLRDVFTHINGRSAEVTASAVSPQRVPMWFIG